MIFRKTSFQISVTFRKVNSRISAGLNWRKMLSKFEKSGITFKWAYFDSYFGFMRN